MDRSAHQPVNTPRAVAVDASNSGSRVNSPLWALAIGAFGIGTTEFMPMGLLPAIARGVQVSIPTAGSLVSIYAIGVMAGAPLMTLALGRFGKRSSLILLMVIFTMGNLLSAVAANYGVLAASRFVTSFSHGAFFGFGALVAAGVAPPRKGRRARSPRCSWDSPLPILAACQPPPGSVNTLGGVSPLRVPQSSAYSR